MTVDGFGDMEEVHTVTGVWCVWNRAGGEGGYHGAGEGRGSVNREPGSYIYIYIYIFFFLFYVYVSSYIEFVVQSIKIVARLLRPRYSCTAGFVDFMVKLGVCLQVRLPILRLTEM